MKPAARLTDLHTCPMVNGLVPHVGGPILPTCHVTTLIGGLPAARVTDKALCVGPPDVIASGAPSTFIGGLPAARLGDQTMHGGIITMGCPTVLIGDRSGGAGGGSGGGGVARAAAAALLQVMTMRDAKAAGAPFCEECAAGSASAVSPSASPQADTLRAARAAGTPFCEECP
ncbi:MAG: PAAR domain-containing protein [Gemmatimonadaceae bacterium]|nr:PAAR domain-containing protein [Gemmatimonadaceae bacterium]